MTDTLAKQFDAALEQTALDISGIGDIKLRMTTVLTAMLKAEYFNTPDASLIKLATVMIDEFVDVLQAKATEAGMGAAAFGRTLAMTEGVQQQGINSSFDRINRMVAKVRRDRQRAEEVGAGISRDNSMHREGIALPNGTVVPAH